jgi:hypothetical protein
MIPGDRSVKLGGRQIGMTQHLLDGPEIRPAFQ